MLQLDVGELITHTRHDGHWCKRSLGPNSGGKQFTQCFFRPPFLSVLAEGRRVRVYESDEHLRHDSVAHWSKTMTAVLCLLSESVGQKFTGEFKSLIGSREASHASEESMDHTFPHIQASIDSCRDRALH